MASRIVLDGIVPVCSETPPKSSCLRSTTSTRQFCFAAAIAAFCPAGPLPTTIKSYRMSLSFEYYQDVCPWVPRHVTRQASREFKARLDPCTRPVSAELPKLIKG